MKYVARVSSQGKRHEQAAWLVTLVALGFFAFTTFRLWPSRSQTGVLVVLLVFLLMALALVVFALISTLQNRRYGRLELELDPSPGSLGGHVGGSIDVPILPSDGQEFRVSLSCVEARRGSEDEARTTKVWQRSLEPEVDSLPDRVRLRFAFEVPASLRESGSHEEVGVGWSLRVVGDVPGIDLDTRFTVPVESLDPPRFSTAVEHAAEAPQALPDLAQSLPADVVVADVAGEELRLHFVPGRTRVLSRILLVVALLGLAASGWLFWIWDPDAASYLMPFPFFAIFVGAFALVFLWGTIHYADNGLDARLKPDWLTVSRRRFGKIVRKTVHRRQIESIRVESLSLSRSSEAKWAVYRLRAELAAGGKLTVADGIPGSQALDRLVKVYEDWFGQPIRYV